MVRDPSEPEAEKDIPATGFAVVPVMGTVQ